MPLEFDWRLPLERNELPGQWIQRAQAAEYVGLHGLWLPASAVGADSLGVAAMLCAHTRHLQLSVGFVVEAMLPAALANTLRSLQSISAGRAALYLHDSHQGSLGRAFGEWLNRDQHGQRIDEYLHILHSALSASGALFDFQGQYFHLENAGGGARMPSLPIILDASQRSALLAAHADLCLLGNGSPPWLRAQIKRLALPDLKGGYAVELGIIVRDDGEQALDAAWQEGGAQVSVAQPEQLGNVVALSARAHPLRALEVYPHLYRIQPDAPLQLVGSVSEVRTRLEELHDLGIRRVILHSALGVAELLHIGERLLPALGPLSVKDKHHEP